MIRIRTKTKYRTDGVRGANCSYLLPISMEELLFLLYFL
jgi:hypothetical protein